MPNLTLRDVPTDLHAWLKQRAVSHHRSVNKEIVALLEAVRAESAPKPGRATAEELLEIGRRASALPLCNRRGEDEILGYGSDGLSD